MIKYRVSFIFQKKGIFPHEYKKDFIDFIDR